MRDYMQYLNFDFKEVVIPEDDAVVQIIEN